MTYEFHIGARINGYSNENVKIYGDQFTANSWAVNVTFPNGNEVLKKNSSYSITWTSQGDMPLVKIEFSSNGGSTWNLVANNVNNSGSYSWSTPDVVSSREIPN